MVQSVKGMCGSEQSEQIVLKACNKSLWCVQRDTGDDLDMVC